MCGIVGWIDGGADLTKERRLLEAMTATLAARGPDAEGYWLTRHAAIGHRRLSVIDPENGAQPMIRRRGDQTFVISYNGELYNTDELRQQLAAAGHSFTTRCDTEVLLASYIEWGAECVHRLNGIFAFAVWEERDQVLFLARDRIGVKPLFYARRGSAFLFASEIKALLVHPSVPPVVDAEGLAEVLMLAPGRTPGHGVFRGIHEVRPGWSLLFRRGQVEQYPYWSLLSAPHSDNFGRTVARVRELVEDAAERQLVSDVPICTLLSGGLDSSILTALVSRAACREGRDIVDTFSVDYRDNDQYFQAGSFQPDADGPWVAKVSAWFGTSHRTVLLDTPELTQALPAAAAARDMPGMADVDTSLYLFSREIKKHATVALSGECADEIFGGYPWFHRPEMRQSGTFPWARQIKERAGWLTPEIRAHIRAEEYVGDRYADAVREVPALAGEDDESALMRTIYYLSLTRFMPVLLDRKDRMSMAFGLEIRVPFCDHRLVEYAWNIPWKMKNWNGREKGLLRRAVTGLLPEDVLWRRKSPYPKTHNPGFLTTVYHWVREIVSDPESPVRPLLDLRSLTAPLPTEASVSPEPWFGQLMGVPQRYAFIIQLDAWMRRYRVTLA